VAGAGGWGWGLGLGLGASAGGWGLGLGLGAGGWGSGWGLGFGCFYIVREIMIIIINKQTWKNPKGHRERENSRRTGQFTYTKAAGEKLRAEKERD